MDHEFMREARRIRDERKCSMTEAMSQLAAEKPGLHRDFLDEAIRPRAVAPKPAPHPFLTRSRALARERGCTLVEAMRQLAAEEPALHATLANGEDVAVAPAACEEVETLPMPHRVELPDDADGHDDDGSPSDRVRRVPARSGTLAGVR